jgi:hypothetical protein
MTLAELNCSLYKFPDGYNKSSDIFTQLECLETAMQLFKLHTSKNANGKTLALSFLSSRASNLQIFPNLLWWVENIFFNIR